MPTKIPTSDRLRSVSDTKIFCTIMIRHIYNQKFLPQDLLYLRKPVSYRPTNSSQSDPE